MQINVGLFLLILANHININGSAVSFDQWPLQSLLILHAYIVPTLFLIRYYYPGPIFITIGIQSTGSSTITTIFWRIRLEPLYLYWTVTSYQNLLLNRSIT